MFPRYLPDAALNSRLVAFALVRHHKTAQFFALSSADQRAFFRTFSHAVSPKNARFYVAMRVLARTLVPAALEKLPSTDV